MSKPYTCSHKFLNLWLGLTLHVNERCFTYFDHWIDRDIKVLYIVRFSVYVQHNLICDEDFDIHASIHTTLASFRLCLSLGINAANGSMG